MGTRKVRKKRNNRTRRKKKPVYSNEDFNSNDGMLTTVWGPSLWHTLHTISFNYPKRPTSSEKKNYKKFIMDLKYVLPCGKCRKNLPKKEQKLKGEKLNSWLKKNDYPDGFEVLCWNCNLTKGSFGHCPHEELKK